MKKNKKILLITAHHIWSMGSQKGAPSFFNTIDAYSQAGFKVDLITAAKPKGKIRNVKVHAVNMGVLDKYQKNKYLNYILYPLWWSLFQISVYRLAKEIIDSGDINLVYAYEIQAVPIAYKIANDIGKPLVTRFQGTKLEPDRIKPFLNFKLSSHSSADSRKIRVNLGALWYKLKYFDHVFALKLPADITIMTNDGTQGDRVLKKLGNRSQKVFFWLNGIDKKVDGRKSRRGDKYHGGDVRKKLGIKKNENLILMVSRLVSWKRVDRMISALPKINGRYKLVVVGDGATRPALEKLACDLRVRDSIIFTGALRQEEVDEIFNAADIFVSLYDLSNVGNPLLQAMQLGKCIVTLNNGDTKKFIDNTRGVIINPPKEKKMFYLFRFCHFDTAKLLIKEKSHIGGIASASAQLRSGRDGSSAITLPRNDNVIKKLPNEINKLLLNRRLRNRLGRNAQKFAHDSFWSWKKRMSTEVKEVRKLINNE